MKNILALLVFISLQIFVVKITDSEEYKRLNYKTEKIIVKTKSSLKISEATGKISTVTGSISLDKKIKDYNILRIEPVFKKGNGDAALYEKYGMDKIYVFYFDTYNSNTSEEAVKDFNSDKEVEYSEPVFTGEAAGKKELSFKKPSFLPNDEMFPKQWYLNNDGQIPPTGRGVAKIGADINMINAWDIEKGSDEIIVAILDSGVKEDHPDLRDNMWVNKGEIPDNNRDDDDNGYIDDYTGWDFAYEDNTPTDGFGHGTNIASVIGCSTNNLIGFSGVSQKVRMMNCKNLSANNNGEYIWWAQSIKYAVDNGARIINMSEGGQEYSKTLKTAIEYAIDKDVLVVAAMMNKGDDADYYPASFKGVFAVGATDTDDNRCLRFTWGGGSCWGKHISVVAPGNKIYGLDFEDNNSYESMWSGTSQSTAIVSGIGALLLAQQTSRSSEDVKMLIKNSARDQVGDPREDRQGWDKYYGYGRVDAYSALNYGFTPVQNREKDNEVRQPPVTTEEILSNGNKSEEEARAKKVKIRDEEEEVDDRSSKPDLPDAAKNR